MFKNLLKKKDFSFLETYTTFGHRQRWWNYLRRSHKTIGLVSNTDSCHYKYPRSEDQSFYIHEQEYQNLNSNKS